MKTFFTAIPGIALIGATLAMASIPAYATATIIDDGAVAPTANIQIAQLTGGGANLNYLDDTDYPDHLPGVGFTPTSTFTLGSITLESQGGVGTLAAGDDLELYIYSAPNTYSSLTQQLAEYTLPIDAGLAANPSQYFTFAGLNTVGTPITLTSGDSYVFVVTQPAASGSSYGLELENAAGTSGGEAGSGPAVATNAYANNAYIDYNSSPPAAEGDPAMNGYDPDYSRVFEVGSASAAPEPSQLGMLALMGLGLGGLILTARKRQLRQTSLPRLR
jgi:hypothetical protein